MVAGSWGLVADLWALVGSPLRYLYGLVQSPEVRDLCGHVSSSPKLHVDSGALAAVRHRGGIARSSMGDRNGSRQCKDPERADWAGRWDVDKQQGV